MTAGGRAACVIGVGQHTWRPDDDDLIDGSAPEPLTMWEHVVRLAAEDAGAGRGSHGVRDRLGALRVIYTQSWPYDDPADRLAARLGVSPVDRQYSGIGGTRPMQEVMALTDAIERGQLDVGCVVGAEALATVRRRKKAGERPAWSHRDPDRKPFPLEAPFLDTEIAHEVFQAWLTFACWDIGRRARLGRSPEEYRRLIGDTMAPLSSVAAADPHAWFPISYGASTIVDPSADNRMVGYPYTKRCVAVMDVDMAAAVIVASQDAADVLGVPMDRRVYLRGAAYGTDPVYLAEHQSFGSVPGMRAVSASALRSAGVGIDDVAHLDLYSCFPSSLHHAADALGISSTDRRGLTVTGGLPYFGGPGSNYLTHSIAAMVDVLRNDPGSFGLTSGVGMHMTKHAFGVWSTSPPGNGTSGVSVLGDDTHVQTSLDAHTRYPIVDRVAGAAKVATYSVVHGRDGEPTWALLVCDVPEGERCYARVEAGDPDGLAFLMALEAEEWVGRTVSLTPDGHGRNVARA